MKTNTPKVTVHKAETISGNIGFNLFVLCFLAFCAFLIYNNSLHNPYIWDDQYLILNNHFIRSFKFLPEVFSHHLYYSTAGLSNFYRPLQTFFLMLDYSIWGLNPLGYHITSILFHISTAFIIYLLLSALFGSRKLTFMISVLFLIHPVNSTVVDYISSRADSQAAFFIFLAICLFIKYISIPGNRLLYIGSGISFIFALLSKELAIVTPFLITITAWLLYKDNKDSTFRQAAAPSEKLKDRKGYFVKALPFYIILGVYILLRFTVLGFATNVYTGPNLYIRLLTACESFCRLMLLLMIPGRIHIEKSIPFSTGLFQPGTFIALLIFIMIGIFMYWVKNRSRKCFFGLSWFFISLLPMANIMPINATLADHWLYLPCMGFFLAIIGGISDIIGRTSTASQRFVKKTALSIYLAVIIIFTLLTVRQNTIWTDPIRFYRTALKYSPKSFRAHNELGVIYLENEDMDNAITEFQMAIKNNPGFDQAYDNLGTAYDMKGDFAMAVQSHGKALELNPNNAKAYNNLGNAYNKSRQFEKAIAAYKNALRLNPDYKAAYNNLGAACYQLGDFENARRHWEKALEIDPDFKMARDNLEVLDKTLSGKK